MDYSGKIITKNAVEPSQTSAPGVWTLDQAAQAVESNTWPIANVPNPISRSLRFNSADSAKLTRTPATAGNRKTWTFSAWVKRSALSASQGIFHCYDGSASRRSSIQFNSNDTIGWDQGGDGSSGLIDTVAVYRDVSSWYHLVCVADYTNGTAANRAKIYINGVLQSVTTTDDFENADGLINSTNPHQIGSVDTTSYFSGYLTQVQFIDGQALTPSYFGMTDPRTGAWISKPYTGTYGTNGFYLNFSDNSTTAALGTDYSGNSNTWTTNNFSVTAGSGNDSMVDVPTPWIPYNTTGDVGGVVRGNYSTLNPLQSAGTLANGNLDWTGPTGNGISIGTVGNTSGKWYWECNLGSTSNKGVIGLVRDPQQADINTDGYSGNIAGRGYAIDFETSPPKLKFNGTATDYGTQPTATSDVLMVALDLTNNSIFFGMNGTWYGSSNPATNTSPAYSSITAGTYFPFVGDQWGSASSSWVINFGQRPFAYTPPAGFKSLCTTNLSEPTILDGGDYFNAVLYTGTNSNQSITGVGFQPDFVWAKARSIGYTHNLQDSVRGSNKVLFSNLTDAEGTQNSGHGVLSFNSDGFSLGLDSSTSGSVNASGQTYVAWNWKASNAAGVTNNAGTITSTVSASTTAGFSIATYTGNATSGATVGHGLGVAPSMVIVKSRTSGSTGWYVYHASVGNTKALLLNSTIAADTFSGYWNNTTPSSTVFTLGDGVDTNASGGNFVGYCFAAVPGYSAFGSYTGNGSSDGPFVYTGFQARYLLIKCSSASGEDWTIQDTARDPYNPATKLLVAQSSAAESTAATNNVVDTVSNGFKVRTTSGRANSNGATYIYAAFASNPFKYSNAR